MPLADDPDILTTVHRIAKILYCDESKILLVYYRSDSPPKFSASNKRPGEPLSASIPELKKWQDEMSRREKVEA